MNPCPVDPSFPCSFPFAYFWAAQSSGDFPQISILLPTQINLTLSVQCPPSQRSTPPGNPEITKSRQREDAALCFSWGDCLLGDLLDASRCLSPWPRSRLKGNHEHRWRRQRPNALLASVLGSCRRQRPNALLDSAHGSCRISQVLNGSIWRWRISPNQEILSPHIGTVKTNTVTLPAYLSTQEANSIWKTKPHMLVVKS